MDALDDVLDLLRVRGSLLGSVRAGSSWGLRLPAIHDAVFHAVLDGTVFLQVGSDEPRRLRAGDIVLLPTGRAHVLASDSHAPVRLLDHQVKACERDSHGNILIGGRGDESRFLCATYEYDRQVRHPLLAALPDTLIIHADDVPPERGVSFEQSVLKLLENELSHARPAQELAMNRMIDLLFVHVIRAWIDRSEVESGWWRGFKDPIVGVVLAQLHERPHEAWTLERLGRDVNASRATLTRRFGATIGMSPLAYLAQWRLELAARELRDTDAPVGAIAHGVGYASEFAFSRAFARARGVAPGRYRSLSRVQLAG